MMVNLADKIGDWNPQLLRELKGRGKILHIAIAVVTSLALQLVVFLYQLREFPGDRYSLIGSYCSLSKGYQNQQNNLYRQQDLLYQQLSNAKKNITANAGLIKNLEAQTKQVSTKLHDLQNYLANNFCPHHEINLQLWWRDHYEYIFLSFSVIFIFTLLVAGTYLLINDLAKEENRGTLNFIRLSPQSASSILTGKILGVPFLIYLFTLAAIPLHLWAGRSANIASSYIFSYYLVLIGSCIFFYSAALLFGLFTRFFSGFQPWLGSGAVLLLLIITMLMASSTSAYINNPIASLRLFSPWDITNYLFPNLLRVYKGSTLQGFQFFHLPLGKNVVSIVGWHLLNYGLASYWVWQALKRRFHNQDATILSKGQSYAFMVYCQVIITGLTIHDITKQEVIATVSDLIILNLLLVLSLIFVLSPHRQSIQDWARYRHQNSAHNQHVRSRSLWQSLIWDEKSPAIIAIAINLAIVATPLLFWILLNKMGEIGQFKVFLGLVLFITMMMIYATIAQLMLLMKTPKRSAWAMGSVAAAIVILPMVLQFLDIRHAENPALWLFSAFPWTAVQYATNTTIFTAVFCEFMAVVLLNFQLTKQVKLAGESSTKALLSGR
jgi:hypothetical protein